jgi:hypothetical protein
MAISFGVGIILVFQTNFFKPKSSYKWGSNYKSLDL